MILEKEQQEFQSILINDIDLINKHELVNDWIELSATYNLLTYDYFC